MWSRSDCWRARPWTVCVPAYCRRGCFTAVRVMQGQGSRLLERIRTGSGEWVCNISLCLCVLLSYRPTFGRSSLFKVGVGKREEDAAGEAGGSSCGAWGGNRGVALAGGLDWDGAVRWREVCLVRVITIRRRGVRVRVRRCEGDEGPRTQGEGMVKLTCQDTTPKPNKARPPTQYLDVTGYLSCPAILGAPLSIVSVCLCVCTCIL